MAETADRLLQSRGRVGHNPRRSAPYHWLVEIITKLREAASRVLVNEPVAFAYLFGSQVGGVADHESDVDVAVMIDDSVPPTGYLELSLRIARELEMAAGVGHLVEVVILNEAPLPLAGRVVREGKALYSKDEPARVRYESLTFREFTDFDREARLLDEELIRAHAERRL